MEIFRNSGNKFDYLLQVIQYNRAMGRNARNLLDIILDFDTSKKMQILQNTNNEYNEFLEILGEYRIEEIIFSIDVINDGYIEILNKYLLHKSDDEIKVLGDKLKRFASIDGKILCTYRYKLIDYLQNENEEKIQYLEENFKRLYNINEEILDTCRFEMLTEKYKDLNTKLDFITCDPEVQEKILNLNDNQYNILIKILNITEKDNTKDWIPILDNLLNGLNSNKFEKLVENLKDIEEVDDQTLRRLAYILSNPENIFNIENIQEVKNFNRQEYVEKIKQGELKTEYIASLTEVEKLQLCILEKKYGQSLEECKRLLAVYGKDLDEFELNSDKDIKIKSYLESIRNVLNTYDKQTLEELYNSKELLQENYLFNSIIESQIREYFARQHNNTLYKVDESKKIEAQMPLAEGIELYDSGENFIIELTSLGAYSQYNYNANFNDEWNRKLIKSHGFCTTPIANNNLATARIKYCALGFSSFSENSLLLSAPWDMNSTEANEKMNTSQYLNVNGRTLFCIPQKLIDNIRHTHPENVRERRTLENGKTYKKQPDFVVYIPQISLEKYMELQAEGKLDDRDERNKLLSQYVENDEIWHNSVKAARDFATITEDGVTKALPIVIVDRTYLAIKEKEKIDRLEDELRQTGRPDLINRIIVDSENNRTGNTFCAEIKDGLFSENLLQERIDRIEQIIKELEKTDKELANQCKQMLIKTTMEEERKYGMFGIADLRTKPAYDHNQYLNRWIEEYNKPENMNEFRNKCLGEQGKQCVAKIVIEIEQMDEYPESGIHSKKHIQDVVLFSYMIAKNENKLDEENIMLLLQAAKYHDSGRNEKFHNGRRVDGKEEHAEYSTKVAQRCLREQGMEPSKIAMVQVAILYHEHLEKNINEFDELQFQKMCLEFGVEEKDFETTRLMCKYLKDADALDRTRFQGNATLQPRYLRTGTAKGLIGEARKINDRYRQMEKQGEHKSIIHIIDEEEIQENNNMVSGQSRSEATEIISGIMMNKSEQEVSDNGR